MSGGAESTFSWMLSTFSAQGLVDPELVDYLTFMLQKIGIS